ncbi:MAG: bacterial Ig-like domain-containing protein [Lachnospiraceae bacterium]|nr:bacterial Ig-like domain-containing protein [Lachnospiraceae bacterium]
MKLVNKKQKRKQTLTIIAVAVLALVVIGALVFTFTKVGDIINNGKNPDDDTPIVYQGISLVGKPNKLEYMVGEAFDPTGIYVQVIANKQTGTYFVDENNPDLKITGFDSTVPNDALVITVTYKEFSTAFTVKIKEEPTADPTLKSIKLSDNFQTTYTLSKWNSSGPSIRGVNLILVYSDGSEIEIPMSYNYCTDIKRPLEKAGTTDFTVVYNSNGIMYTTVVTVNITN